MNRILAVLATLTLAACGAGTSGLPDDVKAADVAVHNRVTLVDAPAPTTDKVIVFVVENKGFNQMKTGAPRLWALGQQYGVATNFYACTHPSQPNYTCMVAGAYKERGITSNSYKQIKGPSLFGNTWKAGRSFKVVAESMGTDRCRQSNNGKYAFRHNPPIPFKEERALCEKYDFDFKYFAGDVTTGKLANVEFVIPNNCSNAHDCSIATADNWIKARVDTLMAGPDWKAGRLTIVVTADEDNKQEDNRILTVVAHPSLSHKVVSTKLTLYSLHRLLADFGHTPPLGYGKTAPDMAAAFGLVVQ